jgi:2-phosphosulfolactate phosphatase
MNARYVARSELDQVRGVVVAVDVLRAFTTAAYAFAGGAAEIWLVAGVDEAIALGRQIPDALVIGEEHGRRPAGFDLSNSPVEIANADLDGRVLVQRTSAGTQGVIAATGADRLFAASLVCASATAAAINDAGLGAPTYVITGRFPDALDGGEDDVLTAHFIEAVRLGDTADPAAVAAGVAATPEAAHTLAAGDGHVHRDDVVFATSVDRFDFAMEVERVNGGHRLTARTTGW